MTSRSAGFTSAEALGCLALPAGGLGCRWRRDASGCSACWPRAWPGPSCANPRPPDARPGRPGRSGAGAVVVGDAVGLGASAPQLGRRLLLDLVRAVEEPARPRTRKGSPTKKVEVPNIKKVNSATKPTGAAPTEIGRAEQQRPAHDAEHQGGLRGELALGQPEVLVVGLGRGRSARRTGPRLPGRRTRTAARGRRACRRPTWWSGRTCGDRLPVWIGHGVRLPARWPVGSGERPAPFGGRDCRSARPGCSVGAVVGPATPPVRSTAMDFRTESVVELAGRSARGSLSARRAGRPRAGPGSPTDNPVLNAFVAVDEERARRCGRGDRREGRRRASTRARWPASRSG